MIYITKNDMISKGFERVIDESSKDFEQCLDQSELEHIAIFKSKIAKYYDVDAIFDEISPVREPVLVRMLVFFVLADIQQRNAYRKLSDVSKQQLEWAEKTLKELATGQIILKDLPTESTTKTRSKVLYGNLSNNNFYI